MVISRSLCHERQTIEIINGWIYSWIATTINCRCRCDISLRSCRHSNFKIFAGFHSFGFKALSPWRSKPVMILILLFIFMQRLHWSVLLHGRVIYIHFFLSLLNGLCTTWYVWLCCWFFTLITAYCCCCGSARWRFLS